MSGGGASSSGSDVDDDARRALRMPRSPEWSISWSREWGFCDNDAALFTAMVRNVLNRVLRWTHLPAVVVMVVGCITVVTMLTIPSVSAIAVLPGMAMIAQGTVLLARSSFPVWTLGGCVGLDAVVIVATSGETGSGALAVIVASYSLIRMRPTLRSAQYLVSAAVFTATISSIALLSNPEFSAVVAVGASLVRVFVQNALPAVVADVAATRTRLVQAYRERAEHAERDRQAEVDRALQDERTALARELHDIAAHHLTGIIVSIQAAAVLLRNNQTVDVDMYLKTAIGEANRTLDQLRATVGLLRDGNGDDLARSPTHGDSAALVEAVRGRGSPIDFHRDPRTPSVIMEMSPTERVTVFRMVQESLANAAQHAPGAACTVEIVSGADLVTVTVTNDAPQSSTTRIDDAHLPTSGLGLIGMRERAHLIGADLRVEPIPGGGWQNRLVVAAPKRTR